MPRGNQFPPLGPDGFEINTYNLTAPTQFPALGPDGFEIDTTPQPNIQQPQPNQQFDELIDDVQMQGSPEPDDDPLNDAGPQAMQQQAQQQAQQQQQADDDTRDIDIGPNEEDNVPWIHDLLAEYKGQQLPPPTLPP